MNLPALRTTESPAAGRRTYIGLFFVTLATLMYEILLTRLFSVVLWYHFAFMAISLALFGMTIGAVFVFLFPNRFRSERTTRHLALSALLFGITSALPLLLFVLMPFTSAHLAVFLLVAFALTAIPFVYSGVCVTLALTRYPRQVSRLYAADLVGAAVGCVSLLLVFRIVDGLTALLIVGAVGVMGAVLFAAGDGNRALRRTGVVVTVALILFAAANSVLVQRQTPLFSLRYVKGIAEPTKRYEKWNSFSRIAVYGDGQEPQKPVAWGASTELLQGFQVRQLHLNIDGGAATQLTAFDGNLDRQRYLTYDVTNVAHYLRRQANVLVVGAGGGRDVLSALVFGQRSVVAVEMNKNITDAVNGRYGDFTGHLDRLPNVTFVNDEARSFISRQRDRYGIIQVSLIDTWAATAAGAFTLSENALYTLEGWRTFMERLTPDGVLSFSRWYLPNKPEETYRLVSLAAATLRSRGIANPRDHLFVVRSANYGVDRAVASDIATLIVSPTALSSDDLAEARRVAEANRFVVLLSPDDAATPELAMLATGSTLPGYPLNLAAPTDDKPFFFQTLRLQDAFRPTITAGGLVVNQNSVSVLATVLIIVLVLTALCIAVPLMLKTENTAATIRSSWHLLVFFASIGIGFMLIEISQMERLIIFLGHPVYSLSVVLFTLLLSSGFGSYLTERIQPAGLLRSGLRRLALLLLVLTVFGALTPLAITALRSSDTPIRVTVAVLMLLPIGVFMGMAFPIGMKLAGRQSADLTPWLWGVNGALSVVASVVALVLALTVGIAASFWVGVASYAFAWLTFVFGARRLGNTVVA